MLFRPIQLPDSPEVEEEKAVILSPEEIKVRGWRFEELGRAGYDEDAARRIACNLDVDLHQACGLLASGCPQEVALRILL